MCSNNQSASQQSGFTLIELIVSMLIFSIISLIAYNALQTYSTSQRLSFGHFEKISILQITNLLIKRDVNQIFNQDIALQDNILTLNSLQNDTVLRVRYLLTEGNLAREDITDIDNVVRLDLIPDIEKFTLRLLNDKNKWTSAYNKSSAVQIKALEVNFEHEYWGKVKQLVMIGE